MASGALKNTLNITRLKKFSFGVPTFLQYCLCFSHIHIYVKYACSLYVLERKEKDKTRSEHFFDIKCIYVSFICFCVDKSFRFVLINYVNCTHKKVLSFSAATLL